MLSLCSNCLKTNTPAKLLVETSRKSMGNEDPISKALLNLQAKIRVLESQRNEATSRLSADIIVNNNNADFCFINPAPKCSNVKSFITSELDDNKKKEEILNGELNDIDSNIERSLACEALKMAEEKCEILETQLSAMKRLFLRKIVAKENDKMVDIESDPEINQLCEKSVEKLSVESDSENAIPTNKENVVKNSFKKKTAESLNKLETLKTDSNQNTLSITKSKPSNRNSNNYPFILGCSTSTSHNSAVKHQINRKTKIQDQITKKQVPFFEENQMREATLNNLKIIYLSLRDEYNHLLNKKMKIVDSINTCKSHDFINHKRTLNEISDSLFLKTEQIHKIKIMLKNLTTNYKTDSITYSNPLWNV